MRLHCYFQIFAITFALIFANSAPAYCQSPQNKPASSSQIQKVKDQIQKLGVAEDVTVILLSGVEHYGAISKIEPDSFEIAEVDLRQMVAIAYKDVKKVEKGYGEMNSSTGKRQKRVKSRSDLIWLIAGVGSLVGLGLWGASKVKKREPTPPFPPFPRIP